MNPSQKLNKLFEHYKKNRAEIKYRLSEFKQIRKDKEQFRELCFCLLTANTSAKMGIKIMDEVGDIIFTGSEEEIKERLNHLRCRFYNRRAHYIYHAQKIPLKLERDYLVKNIKGFGYKESSHFLRNIGHTNYAILDKHILFFLKEYDIIKEIPKSLNKKNYEEIEDKMKTWSKDINIPFDELDLVLWSMKTGEILK
ncbi:MAG: N-glycosylase/DNA lyase [Nanoarchaeota archaeon]|nr:N-glycosylase/DNA lyase [Nanoarchaeota archaeon]